MKQNETNIAQNAQKKHKIFRCEYCDYNTSHSGMWNRHIETKKHKNIEMKQNETNETKKHKKGTKSTKKTEKSEKQKTCKHKCDICSKDFGSRTTLWRHKKKCVKESTSTESVDKLSELKQALEENKALREQMLKDAQEHNDYLRKQLENKEKSLHIALKDSSGQSANTINNNYGVNNNNFNINLFLNEKCANAMTIQDFAKKLQLTMDDLINAKQNKAKGIANIVVKNLEPLAITDRPVHTLNKDEWFVNDENDGWEGKNKPETIIDATRHGIRSKWPDVFEENHPEWISNEKLKSTYVELAGMATSDLSDREKTSISKTIGKNCKINPKDM